MVGRYKIIRGIPSAAPGGPKIVMDATDIALAGIVNSSNVSVLRHDVNPAYLAPSGSYTLTGRDRGLGRTLTAQRATVGKIASEPLFNNNPAINCLAADVNGGPDLTMDDFWRDGVNITWIAVVTIDPVLKASPRAAHIASIVRRDTPSNKIWLQLSMDATGRIVFTNSEATAAIPAANVPAANTAFVVAARYNFSTNKLGIFLNNSTLVAEATPGNVIDFTAQDQISIGGPGNITTSDRGWIGKIARVVTFTSALTDPYLTTAIDALKAKYGIA